ncbi:MAG TPA: carboxymuconolactone decarboxylase family protein [Jatrophihabitantaceae bacterium]|nr:carboxymuconolactone decarboxylase family protein [Jatrophihabitantaceae bacterium]
MSNPAVSMPGAMAGIQSIFKAIHSGGADAVTLELVHLRASQINGCSACVFGGVESARKNGVSDDQLDMLAAWGEAPFFSDAERAALALTEYATRLADRVRPDAVPDEVWDAAADHYDEQQLGSIILMIAITNFFNRVNATIKAPAGTTWG